VQYSPRPELALTFTRYGVGDSCEIAVEIRDVAQLRALRRPQLAVPLRERYGRIARGQPDAAQRAAPISRRCLSYSREQPFWERVAPNGRMPFGGPPTSFQLRG
jgi:hypothetical protein